MDRLQRRWRLARTGRTEPVVAQWWFVVGVDALAVEHAGRQLATREGAEAVPFPASDYQNELTRPAAHRHTHTWGLEPVHYVMEADDLGLQPDRVRRQWAQYALGTSALVVADPVNSVRIPWLNRHFPGATFVHAMLPEGEATAWLRARSGLSAQLAHEQTRRIAGILRADLATVPHEQIRPTLPMPPLTG